jgi:hypothetical protein
MAALSRLQHRVGPSDQFVLRPQLRDARRDSVAVPFYALVDIAGRQYAPPIDYPQFFWGFFAVAIAWQVAFLMIGSDPARFRPLMILAILEKLGFVATLTVLFAAGRLSFLDFQPALPDGILGLLFVTATKRRTA